MILTVAWKFYKKCLEISRNPAICDELVGSIMFTRNVILAVSGGLLEVSGNIKKSSKMR